MQRLADDDPARHGPPSAGEAAPSGSAASGRRRRGLALTALLVAVAAPLLSGLRQDLPYLHHPDEPTNLRLVDRMVEEGDPNPRFFNYPSLFLYVHAAVHLDGPLLDGLGAENAPVSLTMGTTTTDTPSSVVLHRAVTSAFTLLAVAAVYAAGRRLTGSEVAGLAGAAALAASPTVAENAVVVTPDAVALGLVAATTWAAVRLWQSPTWGWHVVAGTLVGLAASAKYNAALVAMVVAVASLAGRPGLRRLPRLGAAAGASVLAFLVTTPYALLARQTFWAGLTFEREHYARAHPGMDGDAASFYADLLLRHETVLLALAVAGAVVAAGRRTRTPLALAAAFPLVYGVVISTLSVRNGRSACCCCPAWHCWQRWPSQRS